MQELESYRSSPRDGDPKENWGTSLVAPKVDLIKLALEDAIQAKDLFVKTDYKSLDGMKAVGYSDHIAAHRKEPLVIDDGGTVFGDLPVLKIAIRVTQKGGPKLLRLVEKVLRRFDIKPHYARQKRKDAKEAVIFALRRVEGELVERELQRPAHEYLQTC